MGTILQEAIRLRQQLGTEWNGGRCSSLDKCGDLLNKIKVV